MNGNKPAAQTVEDFIRSTTMFYIDDDLEKEFDEEVEKDVKEIKSELLGITTDEGLKNYIRSNPKSLDRITSIMNISEEKFKRIITMLRIEKGYMPTGEWSMSSLRGQMIESADWMNEVCNLLRSGARMEAYQKLIPGFYLTNFSIDATTMGRISNDDDIRRLVRQGYEGRYNNKIGDSFYNRVLQYVKRLCDVEGLTTVSKEDLPMVNRVIPIAIPDVKHPRILIDVTYGITTSSAQTKYAEKTETLCGVLREKNYQKPDSEKIVYINVVDGAGWVARQSDLNKIHRSSDYLVNLNTLDTIDEVIKYYL
jgi:hypothetical protein